MRIFKAAFGAAVILFVGGAVVEAQRYGPHGEYEPRSVHGLIDRVHADLNRSYEGWRFSSGDRRRLNHAERELRDFAKKWERGRFDKGELDEAIGSIQHVLDRNHLVPRDRQALDIDVGQLRGMREAYDRHELGYSRP